MGSLPETPAGRRYKLEMLYADAASLELFLADLDERIRSLLANHPLDEDQNAHMQALQDAYEQLRLDAEKIHEEFEIIRVAQDFQRPRMSAILRT